MSLTQLSFGIDATHVKWWGVSYTSGFSDRFKRKWLIKYLNYDFTQRAKIPSGKVFTTTWEHWYFNKKCFWEGFLFAEFFQWNENVLRLKSFNFLMILILQIWDIQSGLYDKLIFFGLSFEWGRIMLDFRGNLDWY